jgi:hypothetical protein
VFIEGRVCDETGVPVSDAVVDVWQGQVHSSVRVQRDGSFLIEAGETAPCVVVEIRRRSA